MTREPSILILGSRSEFSAIVLSRLAAARIARLRAVVLDPADKESTDSRPSPMPVSVADPLSREAGRHDVMLQSLRSLADVHPSRDTPDLIITACFPRRVPAPMLAATPCGGINLHPSLLPAYRGPSPLFWQLRAGEDSGGITLHRLSDTLDAGDIVASERLALAAQATASGLTRILVDRGARLLVDLLQRHDWRALPARAQDHAAASRFSWPQAEDFRLSTSWSARRAYRFMRATGEWGQIFRVELENGTLALDRAIGFDAAARLPAPWTREGDSVRIAFTPGVLHAVARDAPLRPDRSSRPAARKT